MTNSWYVSLDYATFAIVESDGKVTETARIAKWTIGKPIDRVLDYYRRKGARIEQLDNSATLVSIPKPLDL